MTALEIRIYTQSAYQPARQEVVAGEFFASSGGSSCMDKAKGDRE